MDKVKKLLYFYSLILSSVLPLAIISLNQKPVGVTLFLLSLPLAFYFWLNLSRNENVGSHSIGLKTSVPSLIMLLAFVLLWPKLMEGNTNTLAKSTPVPSKTASLEIMDGRIIENLEEIKNEIVKIRAEQQSLTQVLGSADTATITEILENMPTSSLSATPAAGLNGKVTINNPKWQKVDLYKEALASSKIVGKIEYGILYNFVAKTDKWYQIKLPDATLGWVKADFVKEIN